MISKITKMQKLDEITSKLTKIDKINRNPSNFGEIILIAKMLSNVEKTFSEKYSNFLSLFNLYSEKNQKIFSKNPRKNELISLTKSIELMHSNEIKKPRFFIGVSGVFIKALLFFCLGKRLFKAQCGDADFLNKFNFGPNFSFWWEKFFFLIFSQE